MMHRFLMENKDKQAEYIDSINLCKNIDKSHSPVIFADSAFIVNAQVTKSISNY